MMETTEKLTLPYGCTKGLPAGVRVAWGARLIAPADLLHDRQGCAGGAAGDADRSALLAWLSAGPGEAARAKLRETYGSGALAGSSQEVVELYDDPRGKIVGSPQGSGGYVYIAAWLYEHEAG